MNKPTVQEFKSYFTRDFPFGIDESENVLDSDVQKALDLAAFRINEGLFDDQSEYSVGYLYLAAHELVMLFKESSQGLQSQFDFVVSSKGVGSVSVGMSVPQRILDDPALSWYAKTGYGMSYLGIVLPRTRGRIFSVAGGTRP